MNEQSIRIENHIQEIGNVIDLIETTGRQHNLPESDIFDITLALDELITNIISYAYDDKLVHYIDVTVDITQEHVLIQITDNGKPFNPMEIEEPDLDMDLDEIEIGGLGIHLVQNKIDELIYKREDDKNIILLKKKIKR